MIAYALIALVLLAFAVFAARSSLRRRKRRPSNQHLRVDLFAADSAGSKGPDPNAAP
jgi:hypothetical protein